MMTRIAKNRMMRKAALELTQKGVYIPLPKLRRLLQKALSASRNAPAMPPEMAVEQQTDFRTIALETALAIHQMAVESKPESMRWLDSHQWTGQIRRIYRDVLKELEG